MALRIQTAGDDLLRVTGDDVMVLRRLGRSLRDASAFSEVVDGVDTLTVLIDPLKDDVASAEATIRAVLSTLDDVSRTDFDIKTLDVTFGGESGPDMQMVCDALSLKEKEFVALLSEADLSVDMLGFVPGFAYIKGLSERFTVPRLATPRQSVPAGSLGIAAGMIGTYALAGPGGWPIIGRVESPLFSASSDEPFSLLPGMRIKLRPAGAK